MTKKKEEDSITKAIIEYCEALGVSREMVLNIIDDPQMILDVINIMKKGGTRGESKEAIEGMFN